MKSTSKSNKNQQLEGALEKLTLIDESTLNIQESLYEEFIKINNRMNEIISILEHNGMKLNSSGQPSEDKSNDKLFAEFCQYVNYGTLTSLPATLLQNNFISSDFLNFLKNYNVKITLEQAYYILDLAYFLCQSYPDLFSIQKIPQTFANITLITVRKLNPNNYKERLQKMKSIVFTAQSITDLTYTQYQMNFFSYKSRVSMLQFALWFGKKQQITGVIDQKTKDELHRKILRNSILIFYYPNVNLQGSYNIVAGIFANAVLGLQGQNSVKPDWNQELKTKLYLDEQIFMMISQKLNELYPFCQWLKNMYEQTEKL